MVEGPRAEPHAEPALSVDLYQVLAESSADAVLLLDDQQVVRWASRSFTTSLGWDAGDILGATTQRLVHPDDAPFRARAYVDATTTGQGSARARIRRSDGTFWWMSGRLRSLPDGGFILSLRDADAEVAARAEADAALAELTAKEERLRAVLDSMLDAHLLLDPVRDEHGDLVDLVYLEVNRAATDYIGRPASELVGRRMGEVFSGAGVETILGWCREALSTQTPLVRDDTTMTSSLDGLPRRLDVRAVPVAGRMSLTWRDQTPRHEEAERVAADLRRSRSDAYEWITQYRLLADHGRDVVVRLHRGLVEWASPSLATTFGLRPEDWQGRPFVELVHGLHGPDRPSTPPAATPEALGPARARIVDGDGLPRLVEARAVRYPHGLSVVTLSDITRTAMQAGIAATWMDELLEESASPAPPGDDDRLADASTVVAVLHIARLTALGQDLGQQALAQTWRELRRRLIAAGLPAIAFQHRDADVVAVVPSTPDDPTGLARARAWVAAVEEPVETDVAVTNCRLHVGLAVPGPGESVRACTRRAISAVVAGVAARRAVTLAPDPG